MEALLPVAAASGLASHFSSAHLWHAAGRGNTIADFAMVPLLVAGALSVMFQIFSYPSIVLSGST